MKRDQNSTTGTAKVLMYIINKTKLNSTQLCSKKIFEHAIIECSIISDFAESGQL